MIIIFGSNGMLGRYVYSYLCKKNQNVIGLSRKDYDVNYLSFDSLTKFINSKNIENDSVIINCIGIIPQTKNENVKDYIKINSLFPVMLSMICKDRNWKFIHITTDCVFSGSIGKYEENSNPDETNIYGITKSLGELGWGTIIRTSIIGEEKNSNRSLVEWVRSNKNGNIQGYGNHFWNGVTCLQLSKIIHQIIIEGLYWNGIRHIFSPNSVSKFELVSWINDIYNLNIKINKVEINRKIDKTLDTIFNHRLFDIPEIKLQIIEMRDYSV
jgi:dTDP-4-dehydrorhamnose reductase